MVLSLVDHRHRRQTPTVGWTISATLNNATSRLGVCRKRLLALGLNGIWVWSGYSLCPSDPGQGWKLLDGSGLHWGKLDVDYSRLGYATAPNATVVRRKADTGRLGS